MKLERNDVKLIDLSEPGRKIEYSGKVCYKSQNNITDKSYERFITNIVKSSHFSVLEHESKLFCFDETLYEKEIKPLVEYNHYVNITKEGLNVFVSANIRAWYELINNNKGLYIEGLSTKLSKDYPYIFKDYDIGLKCEYGLDAEKKCKDLSKHTTYTFEIEGTRACYDNKTEVLTNNGWKFFKDLDLEEDKFLTRNKNGKAEFQKALNKTEYLFNGKMHNYKSTNINLCVTPNHNLLIKKYDVRRERDYELTQSEKINVNRFYINKIIDYNPKIDENITIKGFDYHRSNGEKRHSKDLILNRKLFYQLLAWYLSDGSTYYNKKENSYTITITQTQSENNLKNKTRERIASIIKDLGFSPQMQKNSITFKSLTIGKIFKSFGISYEKFIYLDLFQDFNKEYAKIFIDEYFKGDGSIDKNGCGKLYTCSNQLADDLMTLTFIAGYTCKKHMVEVSEPHYIGEKLIFPKFPCYVLNVSLKGIKNYEVVVKRNKHFFETYYNDKVYCVEVPNHTLFVRREGIAQWCGNCTHQLVRHRTLSFSQESMRYCNFSTNKFGHSVRFILPEIEDESSFNLVKLHCENCENAYFNLIENGIKPEDARQVLPNCAATTIVVSGTLDNWKKFLHLRMDKHAQKEIRDIANSIASYLRITKEEVGAE